MRPEVALWHWRWIKRLLAATGVVVTLSIFRLVPSFPSVVLFAALAVATVGSIYSLASQSAAAYRLLHRVPSSAET